MPVKSERDRKGHSVNISDTIYMLLALLSIVCVAESTLNLMA